MNIPQDYSMKSDEKQILSHEEDQEISKVGEGDKYRKYVALLEEREMLEEEIKTLGVQLKGEMEDQGLQKCFLPGFGTFSVVVIPRWTYSEDVSEFENALKIKKETEREKGIAENQATSTLRFTREK